MRRTDSTRKTDSIRKTDSTRKTDSIRKTDIKRKTYGMRRTDSTRKTDSMGQTDKGGRTRHSGGRRAAVVACLLAALLCAGCGGEGSISSEMGTSDNMYSGGSMSPGATNGFYGDSFEGAGAESWKTSDDGAVKNNVDVTVDTDRKLIKTVNLSAETREFEQAMATLETQVRQLGGYIEKMETYNGSRYSSSRSTKYSNMTVRIPKRNLDDFLETVSGVCNVTRRNDDLKDVTLSYVDIESRRDTLRTEQERLLSFLEKAETVQEIIALEERISEVRYQLESMEAKLRTIDNQVDFATVNLDISEVQELTPVKEPTAWERLAGGFMENVSDIGEGLVNFGVWFVVNTPYFVLWAIFITVIVVVIRRTGRHNKEKLLAKAAKDDAEWKAASNQAGSGPRAAAPNQMNAGSRAMTPNQMNAGSRPAEGNAEQGVYTGSNAAKDENNK